MSVFNERPLYMVFKLNAVGFEYHTVRSLKLRKPH